MTSDEKEAGEIEEVHMGVEVKDEANSLQKDKGKGRATEPIEVSNSSGTDDKNSNAYGKPEHGRYRPGNTRYQSGNYDNQRFQNGYRNYGTNGTRPSNENYSLPSGVYGPAPPPGLVKTETSDGYEANGPRRRFRPPQSFNQPYAPPYSYQAPAQDPFQTPYNHGQPMYYAPPPPPNVVFRPFPNQVIFRPPPPKLLVKKIEPRKEDPKKVVRDSPTLTGTMIASIRWTMDPKHALTILQKSMIAPTWTDIKSAMELDYDLKVFEYLVFKVCKTKPSKPRRKILKTSFKKDNLEYLIPKDCMHLVVDMYMPPLDSKRFRNNSTFYKWFLDQSDFDINARNREGKTLLHKAAKENDSEFVRFLLDQKADMYVKDFKNQIPFKFAVHFDAWTTVNVFIERDKKVIDQYKFSSKLQLAPWDRFKTHPLEAKGYIRMLERFLHEPSVRAVLPKMMIVLACKHKRESCIVDPIYKKLTAMLLSVKADALISPLSKRLAWINEWLLSRQKKMGFSVFKVLVSRDDNVFSKFSAEIIAMIQAYF